MFVIWNYDERIHYILLLNILEKKESEYFISIKCQYLSVLHHIGKGTVYYLDTRVCMCGFGLFLLFLLLILFFIKIILEVFFNLFK